MNKVALWDGFKEQLAKTIPQLYQTGDGKNILKAEVLQELLDEMQKREKQLYN